MRVVHAEDRRDQRLMIRLSPRERDVLTHVAQGRTNVQIATALRIAPATAKNHVYRLSSATGLTRIELAVWAATNPEVLVGGAAATELRLPALGAVWPAAD